MCMRSFRVILCLFLISLITSCSKNDEGIDEKDLIGDYDRYIAWTTNEVNYSTGIKLNSTEQKYGSAMSFIGLSCDHTLGPGFYPDDEGLPDASVYFAKFNGNYCSGYEENSRFSTFYEVGNYDFTDQYEHGIYIDLSLDFSDDEVSYTTSIGEQPSSSYVKITKSEPDNIELYPGYFNFGQIVTGEYQARFYNWDDHEKYIDVKYGRFKVRVSSYSEGRLD